MFSVVGELTVVDCTFKLEPTANLLGGRVSTLSGPNFQTGVTVPPAILSHGRLRQ